MYYDCQHHPVIGIDFGTAYSSASKWDGEKAEIYGVKGEYAIPSVVYFEHDKFDVGTAALTKGVFHTENCFYGVKRIIGDEDNKIFLGNKQFTPIDICSVILKYIYNNIKTTVPEDKFKCEGTVIALPCYFNHIQCNKIKEAAKLAGIELIGTIEEPIAAALAYGLHIPMNRDREENILVFDLGGGTFDVTIFKLIETKDKIHFNILAAQENSRLGGLDFDEELYRYILKKEKIDLNNYDNRTSSLCRRNLMEQVVKAKEILSYDSEVAYIKVYNLPPGNFLDSTLTLEELNNCLESHMVKIKEMLEHTISLSRISKEDIHRVIKIGGSSKIKKIDNIIEDTIGKRKVYANINHQEIVANGAAIYAAYLKNRIELNKEICISTANSEKSLYFIWLVDCSGSMNIDNRLGYVKKGIKLVIPHIEEKCRLYNTTVNFGIIKFSDTAAWCVRSGDEIDDSSYENIKAAGITSMGDAINLVSNELNELKVHGKTLLPVIFLITDGMPTDDYNGALDKLLNSFVGKSAYKDVITIGYDVDEACMCRFIDDVSRKPKGVVQKEHIVESISVQAINCITHVKDKFIENYNKKIKSISEISNKRINGGIILKVSENK
ncbi:Hsp70 family protein [Clostridium sp. WILCCON 0269]|uniref:Chaperone protein DnaK n=1 Tax=Candidatus Clostridium eludens TaxID=3381663 RepID=A0ABW8SER3_9CLOT